MSNHYKHRCSASEHTMIKREIQSLQVKLLALRLSDGFFMSEARKEQLREVYLAQKVVLEWVLNGCKEGELR